MEKEFFRLASFSCWPVNLHVSPLWLARNGFYHSGEGNRITCSKCGIHFDECTSYDSIVDQHKQQSPNCQLPTGTNMENILLPPVPIGDQGITESDCATNNCYRNIQELYRGAVARATKRGVFSTNHVTKIDRSKINFDQLRHEKFRLNTFYDWPSGAHADPTVLAREGLYYTGEDDRVQCVFCKGFLRNWEPTDIPSAEHKKHFSHCTFVQGLDVGNISMSGGSSMNDNYKRATDAVSQQSVHNAQTLRSESTRPTLIQQIRYDTPTNGYDPPKFPEFSDMTQRISSFKNGQVSSGQTAEALAKAGWFFRGPGDKVQCFQCGGNLKDWEPEDDPWDEHKRWYANCSYLRSQQLEKTTRRQLQEQMISTTATSSAAQYRIEPREIKARMDTTKVRAILDMGYPRALVRKAIEDRLSTTGDDFPNAESLLEEIFGMQSIDTVTRASGLTSTGKSIANHDSSRSSPMPPFSASATSDSTTTFSASSPRSTPPYSRPLHFADSHSLLAPNQSSSSILPISTFQSLAAYPSSSAAVSAVNQHETVTDAQFKAKGKRKRCKKKKATGTSDEAAREEDEQVVEPAAGPHTDLDNSSQLEELEELNLNEIPDEETLQFVEENRRLREARTCKVCMDAEVNTVFLPCGHLVCCNTCSPELRNCPICRTFIRGTVKTFLS